MPCTVLYRGFIDARYWDARKQKYRATMITRFKSIIAYTPVTSLPIANLPCNEGVITDMEVALRLSKLFFKWIKQHLSYQAFLRNYYRMQ